MTNYIGVVIKNRRALFSVATFIAVFFLMRCHEINRPLYFEEGIFAKILSTPVTKPNYLLLARIDEKEIFQPPMHPALMYEIIQIVGWIPRSLNLFAEHPAKNDILVRFFFSLFTLIPLAVVFFVHCKATSHSYNFYLLWILVLVSPLLIKNSMMAQIDGSVGSLFAISLGLSFYLHRAVGGKTGLAGLLFASALFGTGRNEWSIIFLLAVVLSSLAFLKKRDREDFKVFLVILCGGLLGNLISFFYDTQNYVGGLNWMTEVLQQTFILRENGLSLFFANIKNHFLYLNIPIFFSILIAFNFRQWFGNSFEKTFVPVLAFGLFYSAFFSTWGFLDSRYFIPGVFLLLCSIVLQYDSLKRIIILPYLLVLLIELNSWLFINSQKDFTPRSVLIGNDPNCVYYLDSGLAWDNPKISFFGTGPAKNWILEFLRPYRKKLCDLKN